MSAREKTRAPRGRWYKVLNAKGESCGGGTFTWSLPKGDAPGAWHEIPADEPLVQCRSGFHLTREPLRRWARGRHVYLAEVDGDVLAPSALYDDEIVCRRVRLVRRVLGEELEALLGSPPCGPLPKGGAAPGKPPLSAARMLVEHVWANIQEATEHSWTRMNGAMAGAVRLAIEAGLRFAKGDFAEIHRACRGPYWFGDDGGERFYAQAVAVGHDSACQSFEAFRARPPFLYKGARLAVDSKLAWAGCPVVHVTSFAADGASLVACVRDYRGDGPTKIARRFTITLDALRAAEKARKAKLAPAAAPAASTTNPGSAS